MAQSAEYEQALICSKEWAWATNPSNWHSQEALCHTVALDGDDDASALKAILELPERLHVTPAPDTLISGPGTLSALPLEIIFQVMDQLDIKSAVVFSQTSRMSRYLVQNHPSYKPLLQFAMPILKLYSEYGIETCNNINDLGKELRYPYCRCCGRHGTRLFLPLGERVCVNCSAGNPAYWCISVKDAMAIFCMNERQIRKLPILTMKELCWNVWSILDPLPAGRGDFVSAKGAFIAAMDIWGNRKTMCRYASVYDDDRHRDDPDIDKDGLLAAYWVLRNMQIKTPDDPTQLDSPTLVMPPQIVSIMSAPFPWIPKGKTEVDRRYMCRGCLWLSERNKVSDTLLKYSGINPKLSDARVKRIIAGRCQMTYTWEDLMTHVRGCAGAGILMRRYFVERDHQWCLPKDGS
ncbi:uncharacterized protein N7496_004665 [Penicillium cataractarum]|uniref:F-box domain-containing protein n=1 Tax=Penicillium cataractarum TaxID=2100454 RepID=A0A9W9SEQ8_9EURO|nr:uncharacterized protein N7496_004665 [Penicillium cataractarum]KAJ5377256.1 hypothetical protein N7496_004665 [Penicillium cataractarum]